MKIGIDIDNTLVQMQAGFFDFYHKKNKTCIPWIKGKYYLTDFLPILKDEENKMWDEYHDSEDFDNILLMPDAIEVINILKKKHELIFITDRPVGWKEKTLKFIKRKFPDDNFKIVFSKGTASKDKICKDLGISFMIDDHPIKTVNYAESGVRVLLFDRHWNKKVEHENIIRVKNWQEIKEVVENGRIAKG